MSAEHANPTVDRVFESPSRVLTVEFQGGEPLLAFDRIQQIDEAVETRNKVEKRNIQYVITTTLHHLSDVILEFAERYNIQFSTSLDGPAFLQNVNRPTPTKDAYERTVDGINRVRARVGHDAVSALTILTSRSLEHPEAIINEYVARGLTIPSPIEHISMAADQRLIMALEALWCIPAPGTQPGAPGSDALSGGQVAAIYRRKVAASSFC